MCQARRPPNPGSSGKAVTEQVANQHTVRRVAVELRDAVEEHGMVMTFWQAERVVTTLLHKGTIRPVAPREPEPPMTGQTTIDEALGQGASKLPPGFPPR